MRLSLSMHVYIRFWGIPASEITRYCKNGVQLLFSEQVLTAHLLFSGVYMREIFECNVC